MYPELAFGFFEVFGIALFVTQEIFSAGDKKGKANLN